MPQKTRFGKNQHEWIANSLRCVIRFRLRLHFSNGEIQFYGNDWNRFTQEHHESALEHLEKQVKSLNTNNAKISRILYPGFTLDLSLIPDEYLPCIKMHLDWIANDRMADNAQVHEWELWADRRSPFKNFDKFQENLKAKINALDWNV